MLAIRCGDAPEYRRHLRARASQGSKHKAGTCVIYAVGGTEVQLGGSDVAQVVMVIPNRVFCILKRRKALEEEGQLDVWMARAGD